ncbi:hypothetical protein C8Q78DRAFT_414293 [Trametes maxima]|nr:hypothetical protein C8Q78DRAFT_414293 [Trametes maxima]
MPEAQRRTSNVEQMPYIRGRPPEAAREQTAMIFCGDASTSTSPPFRCRAETHLAAPPKLKRLLILGVTTRQPSGAHSRPRIGSRPSAGRAGSPFSRPSTVAIHSAVWPHHSRATQRAVGRRKSIRYLRAARTASFPGQ